MLNLWKTIFPWFMYWCWELVGVWLVPNWNCDISFTWQDQSTTWRSREWAYAPHDLHGSSQVSVGQACPCVYCPRCFLQCWLLRLHDIPQIRSSCGGLPEEEAINSYTTPSSSEIIVEHNGWMIRIWGLRILDCYTVMFILV